MNAVLLTVIAASSLTQTVMLLVLATRPAPSVNTQPALPKPGAFKPGSVMLDEGDEYGDDPDAAQG